MSFISIISQINEASSIPLEDLKAAVKKDKRVNKIFSKNLQLDEIENISEFIQTLKYYILNNKHVINHVKTRNAASSRVTNWALRDLRQVQADTLTQSRLTGIQDEIADIFRDITSTHNMVYSNDTGKSLWGWINGLAGYRGNLSYLAIRELKSLPTIRPSTKTVVYQGLLFNAESLKEVNSNSGLCVGEGLKFLRSVRDGKRIVDIEYEAPTIWYKSKEQALDRAYHGNETVGVERIKIRGDLAFVISTTVNPNQIIVDTALLPPKVVQNKPIVVVDAGKFTARIVHKITPEGEVDPAATTDEQSEVAGALENLQTFAYVFKPPLAEVEFVQTSASELIDAQLPELKMLLEPSAKTKIVKTMQVLLDYYNTYFKDLPETELNEFLQHPSLGTASQVALALRGIMGNSVAILTKIGEREAVSLRRSPKVPLHELSAEELWLSLEQTSFARASPVLKMTEKTPRFKDWSSFSPIITITRLIGMSGRTDLHTKGREEQRKEILKTIDKFFETFDIPKPQDQNQAADEIEKIFLTIERNVKLLQILRKVRTHLDRLKD